MSISAASLLRPHPTSFELWFFKRNAGRPSEGYLKLVAKMTNANPKAVLYFLGLVRVTRRLAIVLSTLSSSDADSPPGIGYPDPTDGCRLSQNMECPHCGNQISQYAQRCYCCGETIPSGQHFLEESGIIEPAAAHAPAARAPAQVRNPGRYRFARLGDRFIAFVLDAAVLFGLFAVVDAWVFMHLGTFDGTELQFTTASLVAAITLNATILFLYGWLLEAGYGATLGKALVGIRVVATTPRGRFSACALRNILRIVDGLGFYLVGTVVAACSGIRQRIGDIYAQTAVIEESFGLGTRVTAIVLWIATLAGAWWAVPRICSANNPVHTRYLSQIVVRVGRTGHSAYFRIAGFSVDVRASSAP